MKYCISKCIDVIVSAYYNEGIKIYYILLLKKGGDHMEIAMAVLKFVGGVIPLVQELLKAFM
ncbi:hypothetical protein [Bacillus cereus]|uniref:hypothetical protein n=1 Tax=Bacillus cereus TaxID=1396 RepID=UPI001D8FE5C1|nr:hypothetical protein [Bacillus cereus]MBE7118372.1 hypothetical protein [Bacillus cereus]